MTAPKTTSGRCPISSPEFLVSSNTTGETQLRAFIDKFRLEMDSLQSKDGQLFIRGLAQYIRQHEKALANSLRLSVQRRQPLQNASSTNSIASQSTLATALSFAGLSFRSHSTRSKTLNLTAHHLFYLLSKFEDLDINTGPMNVRVESIHNHPSPANYISFLQTSIPARGRSDADSIHSVSSVRSAMSAMSAFWSTVGLGTSGSKSEKAKLAYEADLKYVYGSCTVLPSLKLTPNHRLPLVKGYEEFPFDTAVPLFVFKNLQQLEIIDVDFRQFHGWDRLADQLCLLTVKRANLDDPMDLLTNIVLDDTEKRRRRCTRGAQDAPSTPSWSVPSTPKAGYAQSHSDPESPGDELPASGPVSQDQAPDEEAGLAKDKTVSHFVSGSVSPKRPTPSRPASSYRHVRTYSSKVKRSGSGSSNNSSDYWSYQYRSESNSNLNSMNVLPQSKWQRLVYLSLADNALTNLSAKSLAPLTSSLKYFNLSSNLFTEIPDCLSSLSRMVSLDLSNCMIDSLQSLTRYPLPAITTIKLKGNRLQSLAGIERLLALENLDISDNKLSDPMEAARLTVVPNIHRLNVKRNPFTKTFPDYRVRIMNVFRKAAGFLEDIVIDDQPATSSEKRQLIERVPDIEAPADLQANRLNLAPIVVQQQGSPRAADLKIETQQASHIHHDVASSSTRRRKGPKRRIVDLSRNDDQFVPVKARSSSFTNETKVNDQPILGPAFSESTGGIRNLTPNVTPVPESISTDTINPIQEIQSEEYKARIEALRQEFGSNWLSALSEQNWHVEYQLARAEEGSRPVLHRVASPVVISGGRSLG